MQLPKAPGRSTRLKSCRAIKIQISYGKQYSGWFFISVVMEGLEAETKALPPTMGWMKFSLCRWSILDTSSSLTKKSNKAILAFSWGKKEWQRMTFILLNNNDHCWGFCSADGDHRQISCFFSRALLWQNPRLAFSGQQCSVAARGRGRHSLSPCSITALHSQCPGARQTSSKEGLLEHVNTLFADRKKIRVLLRSQSHDVLSSLEISEVFCSDPMHYFLPLRELCELRGNTSVASFLE